MANKVNLGIQLDINTRNNQGWKLGSTAQRVTDNDVYKPVVLDKANDGVMKLAADGEEIRGFIQSIEPASADGYTFGTVCIHAPGVRAWVTGSGLNKGDLVVSAAQTAAGAKSTKQHHLGGTSGLPAVKKGTPTTFRWEVISDKGSGVYLVEAI